jgi:hypothetical protein
MTLMADRSKLGNYLIQVISRGSMTAIHISGSMARGLGSCIKINKPLTTLYQTNIVSGVQKYVNQVTKTQ